MHSLTIGELLSALDRKEVSSAEITAAQLRRIERIDPQVHAFAHVMAEDAMAAAAAADRLRSDKKATRPPLLGVPVGIKDMLAYGPTRAASRAPTGIRRAGPAAQVRSLLAAGAVPLGKLATLEFALARAEGNTAARNPWDLCRSPSGSSSGNGAALAAGLVYGAIGTDTGGSLRMPAAACGVVGFKPTYGLLDTYGAIPLAWSLDCVGPMARTVDDVLALFAVSGRCARQQSSQGPLAEQGAQRKLRIGVPRDMFDGAVDHDVLQVFERALADLRALGNDVRDLSVGTSHSEAAAIGNLIMLPEAAAYHRDRLQELPEQFGRECRQ